MLTHELELPENLNTYLVNALSPVRPLYVFGRSWKATPACPREQAVWDFWKDSFAAHEHCVNPVGCGIYGCTLHRPVH